MLELESAIKHCEEVAEECERDSNFDTDYVCYQMSEAERKELRECASEHRQLAEWLRKLKAYEEAKERIIEVSWEHTFTFSDESESMTYKICALDTVLKILGGVTE